MTTATTAPEVGRLNGEAGAIGLTRVLVALGGLVLVCYGMYVAASIINTLVLTLTLTLATSPVLLGLQRRGWPVWAAVLGGFLVVAGITLAFVVLAVISLSGIDDNLPFYQQRLTDLVVAAAARFPLANLPAYDLSSLGPGFGRQVVQYLIPLAYNIAGLFGSLMLYMFLLLYAFGEVFTMPARLRYLTGGDPVQLERLRRFGEDVRSFFKLNAVMGAIAAVADTAVLLAIGVDFALFWGLLSFLLSFIPNVGFILSMLPPAILALIQFGWEAAVMVILAYCAINLLFDYVLRPRIIGKDLNMSQAVTFLSVMLWGVLLGPTGALLSVPLTLIVKLILEMASGSTRMSAMLVEELPSEPEGEPTVLVAAPTT